MSWIRSSASAPDANRDSTPEQVYQYDDYREFIRDFFEAQKARRAMFSHRYFARRAGLSSPSIILEIIKGKYNLTMKTLPRIVKGLGLKGKAAEYFENLVWYNQATEADEQEHFHKNLIQLRKVSRLYRLNRKQYAYFDHYYLAVIRELAAHSKWNGDFGKLGASLLPRINASEARQAVEQLCEMGLLVKENDTEYRQSNAILTTADIPVQIQRAWRREFLRLGLAAADTLTPEQRYCAHSTISISKANYEEAMRILDETRTRILALSLDGAPVDGVYEIVLQAFPLTSQIEGKQP